MYLAEVCEVVTVVTGPRDVSQQVEGKGVTERA